MWALWDHVSAHRIDKSTTSLERLLQWLFSLWAGSWCWTKTEYQPLLKEVIPLQQSCVFLFCMTQRKIELILQTFSRCLAAFKTMLWTFFWCLSVNGNFISILKSWESVDMCYHVTNWHSLELLDCDLVTEALVLQVQDEKYYCADYTEWQYCNILPLDIY